MEHQEKTDETTDDFCQTAQHEWLVDLEKRLLKQQMEHSQSILNAIEAGRASIEERISLLSPCQQPFLDARGPRTSPKLFSPCRVPEGNAGISCETTKGSMGAHTILVERTGNGTGETRPNLRVYTGKTLESLPPCGSRPTATSDVPAGQNSSLHSLPPPVTTTFTKLRQNLPPRAEFDAISSASSATKTRQSLPPIAESGALSSANTATRASQSMTPTVETDTLGAARKREVSAILDKTATLAREVVSTKSSVPIVDSVTMQTMQTQATVARDVVSPKSSVPRIVSTQSDASRASRATLVSKSSFSLDFDEVEEWVMEGEEASQENKAAMVNIEKEGGLRSPAILKNKGKQRKVSITKINSMTPEISIVPVPEPQHQRENGKEYFTKSETQYWPRITIHHFDLCMTFIIVLNFVMIFVQIEFESVDIAVRLGVISDLDPHQRSAWAPAYEFLEQAFTAIFVLELFLRIALHRCAFFVSPFNLIDALIVLWTSLNLYLQKTFTSNTVNISYLRLFRACRVVWTLRAVRTAHIFQNLRILMRTVASSITALLWSVAVLGLLMVLASMLISQSLNSFLLSPSGNLENQKKIFDLYGSSSRSLYTLFLLTFSDGWVSYVEPLQNDVSTFYFCIFMVYIVFVCFGMLHTIGALFVKDALRIAEYDSQMKCRTSTKTKAQLVSLLEAQDVVGNGRISLAQLQVSLAGSKAKACLASLDFDIGEVEFLYSLLQDGEGHVNCREIVESMIRVKSQARSIDVITILNSTRSIQEFCGSILEKCGQNERTGMSMSDEIKLVSKRQHEISSNLTNIGSFTCPVCAAARKARKKRRLVIRLKTYLMLLRQKTRSIGHTLLCHSYQDYLFYRGRMTKSHYGIELQNEHAFWASMFDSYQSALYALPSSSRWDNIHWIGSSAVPDLVAKPVLDIMITASAENLSEIVFDICKEATDERWLSEHSKGLRFPIGFYMEGWGFLQMPHYHAHENGLVECNVHVFHTGSQAATDKIILVEYLKSPEGKEFKDKYSILKLSLELRYKGGQLDSANYNKEKNFLVAQIIEAAAAWNAASQEKPVAL